MLTPVESSASPSAGLSALLGTAAFAALPNRGLVRITGEDRVRWLNGMATNSIQALKPGQGNYNYFLNAQGRIQADATAWLLEDAILLETARDRMPAMITLLDHFIIMDDVELSPVEDSSSIVLAGPRAHDLLAAIDLTTAALGDLELASVPWHGRKVDVVHVESPLVPRYEVWADAETTAEIIDAFQAAGVAQASPEDLEALRILSGIPVFGTDIRDKDLPQETAQDARALHFAKGCYLGQEIVERIRSRGQVHRTFSGFLLDGDVPAAGTQIFNADAPDKQVGDLTSAGRIQLSTGSVTLAVGYIRREALTKAIVYPGGTATPTPLPYRP